MTTYNKLAVLARLHGISPDTRHAGCAPGFVHVGEAYYAGSALIGNTVDQIDIGFYGEDGGTTGEFSVVWQRLNHTVAASLRVWDDGWHALLCMPEFLMLLGKIGETIHHSDHPSITPKEFRENLTELGFVDHTKREAPRGWQPGKVA